jgi:hypothetical protein
MENALLQHHDYPEITNDETPSPLVVLRIT